MKKLLLITTLLMALSFKTDSKKILVAKGTLEEWQKHLGKLDYIRKIVDESNLNNQEVKFITRSIDSLKMFIIPQLKAQLDSTKR